MGTLGDSTDVDQGFTVEARIAWSSFEGFTPAADLGIGMSVTVSDLDDGGARDWGMWPGLVTGVAHQNSSHWQPAVLSPTAAR